MEILRLIADNPALQEALKELLKAEFETPLTDVDEASDELIGQKVRARLYAKRGIEEAFKKLGKYRTPKENEKPLMPGR